MPHKRNQFVPIPGDKMLHAIGVVAVKWSALEFQIDNLLFWASNPNDEDILKLIKRGGTQQRWDRLKTIIKQEHSNQPGTSDLLMLIDAALSIKGERDKILHGLYAEPDSEKTKSEVVIVTLKTQKMSRGWPVTRLRVLETANKIDELCEKFFSLQIDHGERLGNSILPNAWRHPERK